MLRRLLLNTWLWITLSGLLFVSHGLWAWWMCSGAPIQRIGAPLIVIGIFVAARPFIRAGGLTAIIEKSLPRAGVYPLKAGEPHRIREAARPETEKDVRATQLSGPILIVLGTVLSGYGDLLANALLKFFGAC